MLTDEDKQHWEVKATELGKRAQQMRDSSLIYTISLAFTVLGLSSQYPSFDVSAVLLVIQLTGWLLLFVAGILGLVVAVRMPLALFGLSNWAGFRSRGDTAVADEYGTKHSKRERRLILLGFVHVGMLVAGLTALFLVRVIPHIGALICP